MTETQTLWLALAVVYAVESLRWLRTGSIGVRTWLGRRWRTVGPSKLLGNHRGGLVVLHPFPPLGTLLMAAPIPVTVGAEGIVTCETVIPWKDVGRIEVVNKRLKLDGRAIADAGSNVLAITLQANLRSLAAIPEDIRPPALHDLLRRRLDPGEARARWEKFRGEASALRWLCNGLFLFLFVVFPFVTHYHGLSDTWWMLLIGVFACTTPIAIVCRRHHKRLYPAADEERLTVFLINLLSPASAVRALDRLSLPLLAEFHPLTLARAFCPDAEFRRLAADVLRRLHFPRPVEQAAHLAAKRSLELTAVEEFLRREGLDTEELLRPPSAESDCVAYCPRCLAQFTNSMGTCVDCGVAVLPTSRAGKQRANAD